jgi:hypothetical protein
MPTMPLEEKSWNAGSGYMQSRIDGKKNVEPL